MVHICRSFLKDSLTLLRDKKLEQTTQEVSENVIASFVTNKRAETDSYMNEISISQVCL